jgi:hypothetical protein
VNDISISREDENLKFVICNMKEIKMKKITVIKANKNENGRKS